MNVLDYVIREAGSSSQLEYTWTDIFTWRILEYEFYSDYSELLLLADDCYLNLFVLLYPMKRESVCSKVSQGMSLVWTPLAPSLISYHMWCSGDSRSKCPTEQAENSKGVGAFVSWHSRVMSQTSLHSNGVYYMAYNIYIYMWHVRLHWTKTLLIWVMCGVPVAQETETTVLLQYLTICLHFKLADRYWVHNCIWASAAFCSIIQNSIAFLQEWASPTNWTWNWMAVENLKIRILFKYNYCSHSTTSANKMAV